MAQQKSEQEASHSNLKRIARLPNQDCREVMRILEKNNRRHRTKGGNKRTSGVVSQASSEGVNMSSFVNNDWKNWVALQGNDRMVKDDVMDVGNFIEATFRGDTGNMFRVFSKTVLGKPSSSSQGGGGSIKVVC
jgi:hypothetical protein